MKKSKAYFIRIPSLGFKAFINMITNLKIPGLKVSTLAEFIANDSVEFGRIEESWPDPGMFKGLIIRKLNRMHPVSKLLVKEVVNADTLDLFDQREARIEILPPGTEFLFKIDE